MMQNEEFFTTIATGLIQSRPRKIWFTEKGDLIPISELADHLMTLYAPDPQCLQNGVLQSEKNRNASVFFGEPGDPHVVLRGVCRKMHVIFQPPQPGGLVRGLVKRLFGGDEFGANLRHNSAQLYPRLPFLFLQREDSAGYGVGSRDRPARSSMSICSSFFPRANTLLSAGEAVPSSGWFCESSRLFY